MHQARRFLFILLLALASLSANWPAIAASRTHPRHPAPPAAPAQPVPVVDTPQLLVDMQSGDVLYQDNAGAPWHPASLTKLMTAYVAFQAIQDGRINLDTRVTMSQKAVSQAPGVSGLPAGDSVSMKDALYIMLVKSANDMAVAIAESIDGNTDAFAQEMNGTAVKLGLTRTHYNNPNGLPDPGQVTTARDLAVLAIDLRRTFPQYDDIFRTQMVQVGKVNLKTNNELLAKFEGTTGMKTGYVCGSGLNIVATVNRGGHELLAVLLGGSSARERDQRVAQLLLRGFAGEFKDPSKNVVTIVDDPNSPVMDMTPLLCGAKARAYVTAQIKQFPMGLKGQPSYLGDKITAQVYQATDLGPIGGSGPVLASGDSATQPAEGDAASDDDTPEGAAPTAAVPPPDTTPAVPTVAPLPRISQRRH